MGPVAVDLPPQHAQPIARPVMVQRWTDVDRRLPVAVARAAWGLPYCFGRADHARRNDLLVSRVQRRWPGRSRGATAEIAVRTGSAVDRPDDLIQFLTSRWGLVSATRRGHLRYAPIHHLAWPLHAATVEHLDEDLTEAAGLPAPVGPPSALWSPGVSVRVGRPTAIHP